MSCVVASLTTLPVIGIPMDTSAFKGVDSFLSTLQMPAGVPVATMAVGKPGAVNAAILALQILALNDTTLRSKLQTYKANLAKKVREKDARIREQQ